MAKGKKSTIFVTSIVCICCIGLGTTFGIVFGKRHFKNPDDPVVVLDDFRNLDDDMEPIMNRFNTSTATDYSTEFQSYELIEIGLEKYASETDTYDYTIGNVDAGIAKQTLRNASIRHGEKRYSEALSYSTFEKTAKRYYQEGDNVTTYTGVKGKIATEKATWNTETPEVLSLHDHEEKWGKDLTRPSIYIVSSQTVIGSQITRDGTDYVVNVELDIVKGVQRYMRQIVSMSTKVKGFPTFNYCKLTFTLDENLNLKQLHIDEQYIVVALGIENKTTSDLDIYFKHSCDFEIPKLDEDFNYHR